MSKATKAKRKKSRRKPSRKKSAPAALPPALYDALIDAEELDRAGRWSEARELLEALHRRHPHRRPVLRALVNTYYELNDMAAYRSASQQLVSLEPDDAELRLALAGSCMVCALPAQALSNFRYFLDRWPDDIRAEDVCKTVVRLEIVLEEALTDLELTGKDALQVAAIHEEMLCLLQAGKTAQVCKTGERLLKLHPNFVPTMNNLSQAYFEEDRPEQAIAMARRVLELAPDNIHALANLVRFLCLLGRPKEAGDCLERLKSSKMDVPDAPVKKAEAMSILGDDRGVVEVVRAVDGQDLENVMPRDRALFYHLVAVATLRLGDERDARRYWKRSLKARPGFDLAEENLQDLKLPEGERHGPWAFDLRHWVPKSLVRRCGMRMKRAEKRGGDQVIAREIRRILKEQPLIAAIVPILLDRGDPMGREFAFDIAMAAQTPESIAALREFALGRRGPDRLRNRAAMALSQEGQFPSGPTRLWVKGAWKEVVLLAFEVHEETQNSHRPDVNDWAAEAILAMQKGDGDRAEELLEKALAVEPDAPDLLNNLATAYRAQGREQRFEELIREIHDRFPDYFFGRINMAIIYIKYDDLDRAKEMIVPLLSKKRFHRTEYTSLCSAQIELLLAEENLDSAKSWMSMLEGVNPDHPNLKHWKNRISPSGLRQLLKPLLRF